MRGGHISVRPLSHTPAPSVTAAPSERRRSPCPPQVGTQRAPAGKGMR